MMSRQARTGATRVLLPVALSVWLSPTWRLRRVCRVVGVAVGDAVGLQELLRRVEQGQLHGDAVGDDVRTVDQLLTVLHKPAGREAGSGSGQGQGYWVTPSPLRSSVLAPLVR